MKTLWLAILTLAFAVKLSTESNDLLNLFRPKSNLPPELNDFLLEVQNHKKDFAFIRNAVTQQKRNEKKFFENNILGEDNNNENLNYLQKEINLLHNINREEKENIKKNTPTASTKKSSTFKYSKFLHSPIRLRRELDLSVDHKSSAGVIKRPGIRNSLNDKNKYQAEMTYEGNDDKSQQKNSDIEKKREIEISIKSDGRVIKKIDENENGPKSVILNIKTATDNSECASTKYSNGGAARFQTMINIIQQPYTTPLSPNDFSYMPSINSNANQNKNPAMPINPIASNAVLNPQPYAANNLDTYPSQNEKNNGESRALNNASKKIENNKGKSNNHMEKTIDTALNNQYDLDEQSKDGESGLGSNAGGQNSDFERVQGLVMDNANSNSNNNANPSESNSNTMKKRKRWEPIDVDGNGNILNPAMGNLNENLMNGENIDYIVPLEQGLTTTFIEEVQDNSAINSLEQPNSNEFHLKPNDRFHIVEEATKDIYIVPITKQPCHTNEEANEISPEEKEEEMLLEKALEEEQAEANEEMGNECEKNELKEEIKEKEEEVKEEEKEIERQEAIEEEKKEEIQEAKEEEKELEQQEKKEEEKEHCKKHEHQVEEKPETSKRSSKKNSKKGRHKKSQPKKEFLLLPYNEEKRGRYKKHLPTIPKYKRKYAMQHKKKKIFGENQYINSFYDDADNPEETFDFIPSYKQRQLKSTSYDYDPYLVDFDNHFKESIIADSKELVRDNEKIDYDNDPVKESDDLFEEDKVENEQIHAKDSKLRNNRDVPIPEYMFHYYDPSQVRYNKRSLNSLDYEYNPKMIDDSEINKHYDKDTHQLKNSVGIRKKMKSEDDYSDEEDAVFDKSTKKFKINKTTDEDDDDEYNYSEISNGTILRPQIENIKTHQEEDVNLMEQSDISANPGVHGSTNKSIKKHHYKAKSKGPYVKRENRNVVQKIKLARKLNGNKDNKSKHTKYDEKSQKHKKSKHRHIDRPLSSQQKQDIFLRYNPEFQRWPRFLQDENRYRNVMEKRAMENPRYFHNTYDRFPISNDYFMKPKREEFVKREGEFVKRDEQSTPAKRQKETEEAVSDSSTSNLAQEAATIPESLNHPDQESTNINRQKLEQPINGNAADTATLPPAAKDILETAESNLFENTTLPGLMAVDNNPQGQNKTNNMVFTTPLVFTTNADDLTEGTECSAEVGARAQEKFSPCPDENLNHSSVTMTSILPIISEDATLLRTNISKEDYIDLSEIIGGTLPKNIVSQSLSNAKGSIRKGLNVKRYNTNLELSGYNNSLETKMILDEMSNLMMKLKYHTSCQQLTPDLKSYLKIITRNEMDSVMDKVKDMEDFNLDEHQSSYLFHSGETESLPSKATVMKQLLAKFNALPDNCKERAEPVKEYIESHLAMIDNMNGRNGTSQAPAPKEHTKTKKDVNESNNDKEGNLENQVIEEGLSNSNANANDVIEDFKNNKREAKDDLDRRDIRSSTSQQYGRLADAVRKMRNRRENEKRISQIYGKSKRSPKSDQELTANHGFESPLLINY